MTPNQISKRLDDLQALKQIAEEAAAAYQEAADELGNEITEYIGERSDAWVDGETGTAYQGLVDELGDIEIEVPEVPTF